MHSITTRFWKTNWLIRAVLKLWFLYCFYLRIWTENHRLMNEALYGKITETWKLHHPHSSVLLTIMDASVDVDVYSLVTTSLMAECPFFFSPPLLSVAIWMVNKINRQIKRHCFKQCGTEKKQGQTWHP